MNVLEDCKSELSEEDLQEYYKEFYHELFLMFNGNLYDAAECLKNHFTHVDDLHLLIKDLSIKEKYERVWCELILNRAKTYTKGTTYEPYDWIDIRRYALDEIRVIFDCDKIIGNEFRERKLKAFK